MTTILMVNFAPLFLAIAPRRVFYVFFLFSEVFASAVAYPPSAAVAITGGTIVHPPSATVESSSNKGKKISLKLCKFFLEIIQTFFFIFRAE